MDQLHASSSLQEVNNTVPTGGTSRIKRFLAFAGPAYLVSVGYMDPGNWATDLAGGSKYGYALIWVLLMSNLMALLLQSLSARLGIVRRRDLAQANRETYPKYVNYALYVLAEIAIAACDLAEVLGMAIGIHLLFGMPILWGVLITILDTFLLLVLQRYGIRKMEAFIIGLIAIIGISFLINIILAQPQFSEVIQGFIPSFPDAKDLYPAKGITAPLPAETALYLAIGIIGATVMPHNLYLHSALVQTRKIGSDEKSIWRAIKHNFVDSAIALNLAFFVNAAILVLAATVFFKSGRTEVVQIEDAHRLLDGMLGSKWAPKLFAIALIAAGQSSTITGTLAGQIVMEGYLRLRMNPWVRRLLTRMLAIIPAVAVILIYGDDELDKLLILSQVILSLQLGFAVIPLIHFVSDKKTMGRYVIKPGTKALSWLVASILVYLNLKMLGEQAFEYFAGSDNLTGKLLIITGSTILLGLLVYVILYPWLKKLRKPLSSMHQDIPALENLAVPKFKKIAVALDFTSRDEKIIAYALSQGDQEAEYTLIHIVESAVAKLLGPATDDQETELDEQRLKMYAQQLQLKGFNAVAKLGFRNRVREIVKIVKESEADMLVIGSHGHSGLKDFWHGQTIDAVRHELKIPVLIVNLY
ncbi:MAG: Nramp family divalent metal transporter [Bacteroidota bacterium]